MNVSVNTCDYEAVCVTCECDCVTVESMCVCDYEGMCVTENVCDCDSVTMCE